LGRDALIALIVAYEIAARAGIALHATVDDYHTSGAWNALGVVALASRLRQHDLDTFRHALGIAEYHGPRSQMMREIANPTMLHDGSGMGAMVGMMAAFLAEDGFQGAPAITVEQASEYWSDLGTNYTINQNYIKPYPICRWAHAAIDALGAILDQHDLDNQDIAHIEVRTFSQAAALFQGMPDTSSQAQYSLPFALAVRLLHGEIAPDHIQGPALSDPQIKSILAKIKVIEVEKHARRFPAGRWSDVILTLKHGHVLRSGDVRARGGPEAPMALSEIERKFETMTERMDAPRRHQIWQMSEKLLDENTPFSELLTLLHPPIEEQHA
jgi:2-methylcitrate dehydratase PrpD